MSEAQLDSIDPTIEEPTPVQRDADFKEHTRTYNGFVHLTMWFLIHILLLLVGLYAMTLGGSVSFGAVLMVVAVAALIYGIVSTPSSAH